MIDLWIVIAFFSGFLAVFAVNLALGDLLETQKRKVRERMKEQLRWKQQDRARHSVERFDQQQAEEDHDLNHEPDRSWRERFATFVAQSGLNLLPQQVVNLSLLASVMLGAASGLLFWSWLVGLLLAPLGAAIPLGYVSVKRGIRIEKLRAQLPDTFDLISRTMRAGQTITQALKMVADEFSAPISEEFGYCYDQQNLGMAPEIALRDLARRSGIFEMRVFVLAVMVHREAGGNLTTLLEKLSAVIRERYRIRGVIRALTAEGRMQAVILLILPPVILVITLILNRDYAMTLFDYPLLPLGTVISMLIGALWMQRVIHFDC